MIESRRPEISRPRSIWKHDEIRITELAALRIFFIFADNLLPTHSSMRQFSIHNAFFVNSTTGCG